MKINLYWQSVIRHLSMVFSMNASVAQLVEQRFRKAWVVGSSPIGGSFLFGDLVIW